VHAHYILGMSEGKVKEVGEPKLMHVKTKVITKEKKNNNFKSQI